MMIRFLCGAFFISAPLLLGQIPILEKTVLFGNVQTRDRVVLRELKLKNGLPLRTGQLAKEQAWLLRLNYFSRIELETRAGTEADRRTLMVLVQEKSPWSADPILNQNMPFGWVAGSGVSYDNLFGRRERAGILIQLGAVNRFAFFWQDPWILGSARLFTEFEAYHNQFRYLYEDHPAHFFEKDTGLKFTMGKVLIRTLRIGFSTGTETVDVSDPSANFSGGKHERVFSTEPFVQFDSRDWPVYPFSGVFCRVWNRQSRDGSRHGFSRDGFDVRFFKPVFQKNILAFQTTVEFSSGDVPVVKRLHIGGSKTLRGFEDGSLSGENMMTATLECRMPILFEKNDDTGFRFGYAAVIFADLGAAWYHGQTLNRNRWLGSVGFGFHGILDRLVLRLEWGTRGKGLGFITTGTGVKF